MLNALGPSGSNSHNLCRIIPFSEKHQQEGYKSLRNRTSEKASAHQEKYQKALKINISYLFFA